MMDGSLAKVNLDEQNAVMVAKHESACVVLDQSTPSFSEKPWLLRVDLTNPSIQADLHRQMESPESPDVMLLMEEIESETALLLQGF